MMMTPKFSGYLITPVPIGIPEQPQGKEIKLIPENQRVAAGAFGFLFDGLHGGLKQDVYFTDSLGNPLTDAQAENQNYREGGILLNTDKLLSDDASRTNEQPFSKAFMRNLLELFATTYGARVKDNVADVTEGTN